MACQVPSVRPVIVPNLAYVGKDEPSTGTMLRSPKTSGAPPGPTTLPVSTPLGVRLTSSPTSRPPRGSDTVFQWSVRRAAGAPGAVATVGLEERTLLAA